MPSRVMLPNATALVFLTFFPATAQAQSQQWEFQVAPYVWAAGLKGDIAVFPNAPAASVDATFTDLLENTEVGFMLAGEARHGDFAIVADINYLSLSVDGTTPGSLFSGVELDSKTLVGDLAAMYRVLSAKNGSIEVGGGVRYWHVENEIQFKPGLSPGFSRENTKVWVDPIVAVRGNIGLGSGFLLSGEADIGGFGVASDLTWQVIGLLGYRFNDSVVAHAGYRHLSVDFSDDGFVWDVTMSGPIIGLRILF